VDKELRDKVGALLQERFTKGGKAMACPMCTHTVFAVADGVHLTTVQDNTKQLMFAGQSIPSWVIVCVQCGYVSLHAIGIVMKLEEWDELQKAANDRKAAEAKVKTSESAATAAPADGGGERHG
jgi:hypothetical protein